MFRRRQLVIALACVVSIASCATRTPRHEIDGVIQRAHLFLQREVRTWRPQNGCYSCHNNGDAAQAVYLWDASPERLIQDTTQWLHDPELWSQDGIDPDFKDERLARVQFSAALAAFARRRPTARAALLRAAEGVARDQSPSGAWLDSKGLGSPITYGKTIATVTARDVLSSAGPSRFSAEIGRAERWLRVAPIRNVVEASGVLWGLAKAPDDDARARRAIAIELLRRAQLPSGAFGPYVNAAAEVFDTSLAVLALSTSGAQTSTVLARARDWLCASQQADGSWVETTRPAGNESYAHWISTTAWAMRALVASRDL